jgi:hypothetical protein
MDPVTLILVIAVVALVLFSFISGSKVSELRRKVEEGTAEQTAQATKLDALRKELGTAREDLGKKTKALEEARKESKKKLKKQAQKEKNADKGGDDSATASSPSEERAEIARLKKALDAMELQVATVKKEADEVKKNAITDAENEVESKLSRSKSEVESLKKELDQLKAKVEADAEAAQKKPDIPLDTNDLPLEAAHELARHYRKGEYYAKLYGASRGQAQLAQERFNELQKRYYAVCRELSLATGKDELGGEEARAHAEGLVAASAEAGRVMVRKNPEAKVIETGALKEAKASKSKPKSKAKGKAKADAEAKADARVEAKEEAKEPDLKVVDGGQSAKDSEDAEDKTPTSKMKKVKAEKAADPSENKAATAESEKSQDVEEKEEPKNTVLRSRKKEDDASAKSSDEGAEAKSDEAKADEAKADEAKADEAKADEAKADEAKADEAKADEESTPAPARADA